MSSQFAQVVVAIGTADGRLSQCIRAIFFCWVINRTCVDVFFSAADSLDPYFDMSGPVLTHLQRVTTVTGQLQAHEGQASVTPEVKNDAPAGPRRDSVASAAPSATYLYSPSLHLHPPSYSGRLGFLWRKDNRAETFVEGFVFWLDTVEMVRVAGEPSVFYSAWVFPVYIFSLLATLRAAIAPNSPLLSSAGFALQDVPFLVLRVALIAVFGHVTPVLYPLKNALVSFSFLYFTFLARLKIFKRRSLF